MTSFRHRRPDAAMVLAAGLGKRMQPITLTRPKPLIEIAGRSMLDRALDRLESAGITRAVVNVHYLADQVEARMQTRASPAITISDERAQLLETGGGTKRALPLLGADPFVLVNTDTLWIEGASNNLARLLDAWQPDVMDILLLVAPLATSIGFDGAGDFTMDSDGHLARRGERLVAPFIYAGVAILKPALFADTPDGPFSLNLLFDRAIAQKRLFGLRLDGIWLHVGTPQAIPLAEAAIARSAR